ncbi:glycosyltransferase [Salinibacter ruber]|uniref:glycosyltransferase n=1 Tax=Salinibacter ruber TaxID=146919 RepID=UPI001F0835EE|nr:glycosyltransferase [Salinibacter ruber]MCS3863368.1 hypothetical protein [Salinibacter ruber]MCS4034754.1 hypothetical protein [Salinibacter ruber]MCS4054574.1 hypothetical protein [Salinibacter ruber]
MQTRGIRAEKPVKNPPALAGGEVKGRRYDAVVSLTTPPLLPVAMAVARLLRGQSYGIWSMDLHPEAETAVGMIDGEGPLGRLLYALTDWSYRRAAFTVDLGPHMKERIRAKGVLDERLHTIPVWNKKEEVFPISDDENPLVEEVGIHDKFVVMYSGNAGLGVLKKGRNAGDTASSMKFTSPNIEKYWLCRRLASPLRNSSPGLGTGSAASRRESP